jgi:nucleotide-binding universal stress UspA family protein
MKIVIGHDGSDQGRDALELGRVAASVLGATPVVTTVLTWPPYLMSWEDAEVAAKVDTADLFAAARDHLQGLSPETAWRINLSPAEALYEVAESEEAALVVVGSSHRGPIGKVMLGSVGASLLHGAPCAVLVAPRGYAGEDERSFQHLGVAFDGSSEAWAALETAIGLCERLRAELTVLTVTEPPHYGYSAALAALSAKDYESFEHAEKRRHLERAEARVPAAVTHDGRLLVGDPARTLADAAGEFDLMVIGSRGYGPLKRVLLGSTSGRFVKSARCPVLVLPRGAGVDPLRVRGERGHRVESSA